MRTITTDVLVIGGGATGLGVLRDMALRGRRWRPDRAPITALAA